jgi:phosphatidate cytidylyltransferase
MLRDRAIGVAILVPPLVVAFVLGEPFIAALVVLIAVLGGFETFRLIQASGSPTLPLLGTVLVIAVVIDAAAPSQLAGSSVLLSAIGLALVGVGAFASQDPREGLASWMATVFGALYAAQIGFVLRIGHAVPALPAHAQLAGLGAERAWILLLVLGVWAYDTGAWFVGRRYGKERFLVHLSPSKTYAGLAGGLVATTIVVAILSWAIGQPIIMALLLGPLIGLSAQAGDLAESMLKRAAGAKDSGTLIPGHGGILDRVDSFLFAAPAVALYVIALVR